MFLRCPKQFENLLWSIKFFNKFHIRSEPFRSILNELSRSRMNFFVLWAFLMVSRVLRLGARLLSHPKTCLLIFFSCSWFFQSNASYFKLSFNQISINFSTNSSFVFIKILFLAPSTWVFLFPLIYLLLSSARRASSRILALHIKFKSRSRCGTQAGKQ